MAKQITRDRKLTPEEAVKYRKIREEVEPEKPEIIAKAQYARNEARRHQLAAIMQKTESRPRSQRARPRRHLRANGHRPVGDFQAGERHQQELHD